MLIFNRNGYGSLLENIYTIDGRNSVHDKNGYVQAHINNLVDSFKEYPNLYDVFGSLLARVTHNRAFYHTDSYEMDCSKTEFMRNIISKTLRNAPEEMQKSFYNKFETYKNLIERTDLFDTNPKILVDLLTTGKIKRAGSQYAYVGDLAANPNLDLADTRRLLWHFGYKVDPKNDIAPNAHEIQRTFRDLLADLSNK